MGTTRLDRNAAKGFLRDPPREWKKCRSIWLYHGCLRHHAESIINEGVKLSKVQKGSDFGPGFYLTTSRQRAGEWAWDQAVHKYGKNNAASYAVVLRFRIRRLRLVSLKSLCFVRGDAEARDFWSFVSHCRLDRRGTGHLRSPTCKFYDLVYGPVSQEFQHRRIIGDSDQISFHTKKSIAILNRAIDEEDAKIIDAKS